jgi:hypothetical protein
MVIIQISNKVNPYSDPSASTLELILASILRETGLSAEDVPGNIKKLKELVRQIGTTELEAERIAQYPDRLNEAIQHFMVCMIQRNVVGCAL